MKPRTQIESLDRRQWLKLSSALSVVLLQLNGRTARAQGPQITLDTLRRANLLIDDPLDDEHLESILPAVQRNWDFFAIVRETAIDDDVEPSPMFDARRGGKR